MISDNQAPARKKAVVLAAVGLWALTTILAFWEILVIREMIIRFYLHFSAVDFSRAAAASTVTILSTWVFVPLAILFIGVAIAGAEFHYRRVGQPLSWQVFGRTLAVELSILILALFI
jgi:hypothetical protein